jgi:hypothetical protein
MPKKLVFDMFEGYMDKLRNERFGRNSRVDSSQGQDVAAPVVAPAAGAPAVTGTPPVPGAAV